MRSAHWRKHHRRRVLSGHKLMTDSNRQMPLAESLFSSRTDRRDHSTVFFDVGRLFVPPAGFAGCPGRFIDSKSE